MAEALACKSTTTSRIYFTELSHVQVIQPGDEVARILAECRLKPIRKLMTFGLVSGFAKSAPKAVPWSISVALCK